MYRSMVCHGQDPPGDATVMPLRSCTAECAAEALLSSLREPGSKEKMGERWRRIVIHFMGHGEDGRLGGRDGDTFGAIHDAIMRVLTKFLGEDLLVQKLLDRDLWFMFSVCTSDAGFVKHTKHDFLRLNTCPGPDLPLGYPVYTYSACNNTVFEGFACDVATLLYAWSDCNVEFDFNKWLGSLPKYDSGGCSVRWVLPAIGPYHNRIRVRMAGGTGSTSAGPTDATDRHGMFVADVNAHAREFRTHMRRYPGRR